MTGHEPPDFPNDEKRHLFDELLARAGITPQDESDEVKESELPDLPPEVTGPNDEQQVADPEIEVEEVYLGAMATEKKDKKSSTIKNLLTKALTSATLSEGVGDLLTNNSFFEAADETEQLTNVESVKKEEEKKKIIQGIVAKLMQKLADANVARKQRGQEITK